METQLYRCLGSVGREARAWLALHNLIHNTQQPEQLKEGGSGKKRGPPRRRGVHGPGTRQGFVGCVGHAREQL